MAHQTKVPKKQIINLKFLSDLIELSLQKLKWDWIVCLFFFSLFIIPQFFTHMEIPLLMKGICSALTVHEQIVWFL